MAFWRGRGEGRSLPSVCAVLYLMLDLAAGNVLLMGRNVSKSFNDVEADFTPMIRASGEDGILYLADPLNACTPLLNNMIEGSKSPFVLIVRGGCSFDDKVRNAQNAGFKAAIIYDNEDSGALVAMAGNSEGIKIYAVFISKASGIELKTYAGRLDIELWIIPSFENSSWSIMAMSFISLLAVSVVLATCFFVHKRLRRERPRAPRVREFHGMSSRLVKAMPSLIFTEVLEDSCTSRTCAICLEDYSSGEKLRVLPCRHKFHSLCVDSWLTTWRTFCPVCKQDARTRTGSPSASESTPLLSSGAASPSCVAGLTSFHSSLATSPALPIVSVPPWSARTSRAHSLSSTPHIINSRKSNNLHGMYVSRSFADLRNLSSERSRESYLISPHALTFPLISSSNSRSNSTYVPSSCNASPSYLVGSSSQHTYLCQCESGASILALASTQSLPR